MSLRRSFSFGVLALALGSAGCDAPVVGEWLSDNKLGNGEYNELSVYSDNTGYALVYATHPGAPDAWHDLEFDITWEDYGDTFDLNMECAGCSSDDFVMSCEVIEPSDGTADKLNCKGDDHWSGYPFDWERND